MIALPQPLPIDEKWIPEDWQEDEFRLCLAKQERKVMKKKAFVKPSIWAERHRVLPADAAIPGPWRNHMAQYLVGIMDASFFDSVEEIIMCAAPQVGKSDCINNCLGYAIDRRPGNALIVYPDELTAKENSRDRLQPMIKDSKRLRTYLTGYDDDLSDTRLKLEHMKMYFAWANSPSRLSNKPVPYVALDEEEKYPKTSGKKEASPKKLADKRQRSFPHMRKTWRASSPTIESGPIWQGLTEEAEVRFEYGVRCPHCGGRQVMTFDRIRWPEDCRDHKKIKSQTMAWYECEHCQDKWTDAARNMAVRMGDWRCKETGLSLEARLKQAKPKVIGFQIPAWLSAFVSLSECAAAFLESLSDKTKLKDFKNGYCAEPWIPLEKKSSEDKILKLRDDRPRGVVPGGDRVAALLGAIDTQKYGFYYEIRAFGWGHKPESWCVREGFVQTFEDLDKVMWMDTYQDPDGNEYRVRLVLQDAMGDKTKQVYDFCRTRRPKIYSTMGKRTLATPYTWSRLDFYPGSKKPIPGGLNLLRFDTNLFKNDLSSRLDIGFGDPGCWYYHSETSRDWAAQMTAEGLNEETGFWENPNNKANHAWDCATLLLVAHDMAGVKYMRRPAETKNTPKGLPAKGTGTNGYNRPDWLNR